MTALALNILRRINLIVQQMEMLQRKTSSPYIACGIDLVEYQQFNRIIGVGKEQFIQRVYTENEQVYCADDVHCLAARWAAKEAVAKALGTGFRDGVSPHDIEVEHTAWGKPVLHLFGPAALIAEQIGLYEWDVSLSHTNHFAVAIAVALRRGVIEDAAEVHASVSAQLKSLEKSDLAGLQEFLG
jgi:holo-[acyl-carrier protein] synthase